MIGVVFSTENPCIMLLFDDWSQNFADGQSLLPQVLLLVGSLLPIVAYETLVFTWFVACGIWRFLANKRSSNLFASFF